MVLVLPSLFKEQEKRGTKKVSLRSGELIKRDEQLIKEDFPMYTSNVRIGESFQVEVPRWFGTLHDDDSYYEEIRSEELGNLKVQGINKTYSYCNWMQCREETKGTV